MDWGNAFVTSIALDASGAVTSMKMKLHLEGDFKKTKKKLTWLSVNGTDSNTKLVPCELYDYDYLITKKKLEEDDNLEDLVTPTTEFVVTVRGDGNLTQLKKGMRP